jgi:hypothetical protein
MSIIAEQQATLSVRDFIETKGYEVDQLYVDKFWNNISDDQWIYVGSEMLEWIGYQTERVRQSKELYVKLLSKHFIKGEDYEHLDASEIGRFHDITGDVMDSRLHNRSKTLVVAPDCFKEALMIMDTTRAKEIRKYYLRLEKVFKAYLKYVNECALHGHAIETSILKRDHELETANLKRLNDEYKQQVDTMEALQSDLASMSIDSTPVEYDEFVYVLTSKRYYKLNLFKIGKTANLKSRLSTYNTGNALSDDEQFFLCSIKTSDSRGLEKQLHRVLNAYRFNREWYRIHASDLIKTVNFVSNQQDALRIHVNQLISDQTSPKDAVDIDQFVKLVKTKVEHSDYYELDGKFFCAKCDRDFMKIGRLRKHIDNNGCRESKLGDYSCPTCSKIFTVKHYFDKHISDQICAPKTYVCEHCSKEFRGVKWLENHLEREHAAVNPEMSEAASGESVQKKSRKYMEESVQKESRKYMEESDLLYAWFNGNYEKTSNKEDRLKLKDVYAALKESEYYFNLTKAEKRKLSYNALIEYVERSPLLRMFYKERVDVKTEGGYAMFRNILTNYKISETGN